MINKEIMSKILFSDNIDDILFKKYKIKNKDVKTVK